MKLFRDMCDCSVSDESGSVLRSRMLFRAMPDDITKGEPLMKDALMEGEAASEAGIHGGYECLVLNR